MRWKRASRNYIEDRRGAGGGGLGGFGGLGGGSGMGRGGGMSIPIGGGLGSAGVLIFIVLIVMQMCGGGILGDGSGGSGGFGIDPQGGVGGLQAPVGDGTLPPDDNQAQFVNAVTADVQETWAEAFRAAGRQYDETVLVLFEDGTQTGCGFASSQVGPFYCPADRKVYLDLSFFDELSSRFGAKGDFAKAYVIAHEFGHHVQTILGIDQQVRRAQQENPAQSNDLSVRMELQADCFAGVWAHSVWTQPDDEAVQELTEQDIRDGLNAAAAVGDDRIQAQAGAEVNPDTWTHGSSEQRMQWFQTGFRAGSADACDTYSE